MQTSDSIKTIVPVLVEAIPEIPKVVFDKENPHFHSLYASLGAVIENYRPVLLKHGLVIIQTATNAEGRVGVCTRILHTSGEWIEDEVSVPIVSSSDKVQLAMAAGIIITYLRRYSLTALLNMYADEDTDGDLGVGFEKPARQLKPRPEQKKKTSNDIEDLRAEFGRLYNKAKTLGNPVDTLPKLSSKMGENDIIEKIADITLIIKESEEK